MASRASETDASAAVESTQDDQLINNSHASTADEESPLIGSTQDAPQRALTSIAGVITVLLLGEFISNADATIIMAAVGSISSEFNRLHDANWLSTSYTLGLCAAQPMYGKLSDIYGRKPLLLVSYFLLALGCVVCGIGPTMSVVILGRIISGMGGAGIASMSAIIITDLVPKRDVATWRAYVNISMTLGRGAGGPLGGWLTDTIGWRWLFLLQTPLLGIAAMLVFFFLKKTLHSKTSEHNENSPSIRRVDFLGTAVLATAITAIILLFDRGGQSFSWTSGFSIALATTSIFAFAAFVYVESYVASEPIFDLRILQRRNVVASYLIGGLQISAQVGMMFTVPLYFQVVMGQTPTSAGAHLVPAVLGNTVGGVLAGVFIRKTGRYKPVLIIAGLFASISYVLQFLFWNDHTGFWESLYIIPGGMGTAFASAATFVTMTSFLKSGEAAMATSGYILFYTFSITAGVTATNTALSVTFKHHMQRGLRREPDMEEIIRHAMSDTSYIASLTGHVRRIVVRSYLSGLRQTYVISFASSILGSMIAWTVRDQRL